MVNDTSDLAVDKDYTAVDGLVESRLVIVCMQYGM